MPFAALERIPGRPRFLLRSSSPSPPPLFFLEEAEEAEDDDLDLDDADALSKLLTTGFLGCRPLKVCPP